MTERASYYSVLPAEVRYDKSLTDFERVMFSEISALADKRGFCWAGNRYFAELYGKHEKHISKIINKLAKAEYIQILIDKKAGNARKIYIGIRRKVTTYPHRCDEGINIDVTTYPHECYYIYKDINKQIEQTKRTSIFTPPTLEQITEYAKERKREDLIKPFYDFFTADDDPKKHWIDSKGEKVKSWKQKFVTWDNRSPQKIDDKVHTYDDCKVESL